MRKLSFNEIKEITFGALDIIKQNDGIHFYKCTEKQNKAWANLSKELGERALRTTGIRFHFITNSSKIQFSVSSGNKFEIWINGLLKQQILIDEPESKRITDIELGEGEKNVMIAFPSHTTGILDFIEVEDNSYITPNKFSKKMLFIGDSITQGWESQFDTLSYAYRTGMHFDADFVIQGIGGASYYKSTFDMDIAYDPDTIIVAFGTNDYYLYHSVELVVGAAKEYLSLVKERYGDKRIVVITPIWRADMDEEPLKDNFLPIRDGIEKVAKDLELEAVDGFKLVPHLRKFYADNFLHPDDNGFGLYAENLIKELKK